MVRGCLCTTGVRLVVALKKTIVTLKARKLPEGGKLTLYSLGVQTSIATPLFLKC